MLVKRLAAKDHTRRFETLRADAKQRKERFNADYKLEITDTAGSPEGIFVTPAWLDEFDCAQVAVKRMDQVIKKQQWLFDHIRTSVYSNEQEYDNEIVRVANEGHQLLSEIRSRIGKIYGESMKVDGEMERRLRYNAARCLVLLVKEVRGKFQEMHSKIIERRTARDSQQQVALADEDAPPSPDVEASLKRQFLPASAKFEGRLFASSEIANMKKLMEAVEWMFEETNRLTIEQGSLIDRIDHNVDQAVVTALQGRQQVKKAEQTQKHGVAKQATVVLLVLNAVMLFFNFLKFYF